MKKKPAETPTSRHPVVQAGGTLHEHHSSPTHEEIAQLAFVLYESRGRQDGYDVEDWRLAEEKLVRRAT